MAKYMQDSTDIQINEVSGTDNINFTLKETCSLVNLLYPIGQIIIKGDNEDYSNWLGFTWERTAGGKVLVGLDTTDTDFNAIGKTGGEKKHTLTVDEMPAHNHSIKCSENDTGFGNNYLTAGKKGSYTTSDNPINNTGGGQAHNNLQPYQVVAYWKRIA